MFFDYIGSKSEVGNQKIVGRWQSFRNKPATRNSTVISALGKLQQEYHQEFEGSLGYLSEFKASLCFIVRPCLKKNVVSEVQLHVLKKQLATENSDT